MICHGKTPNVPEFITQMMPSLPQLQKPELNWYQKSVYLELEANLTPFQLSSCSIQQERKLAFGSWCHSTVPIKAPIPIITVEVIKMITGHRFYGLFSEDVNALLLSNDVLGIECDCNI